MFVFECVRMMITMLMFVFVMAMVATLVYMVI